MHSKQDDWSWVTKKLTAVGEPDTVISKSLIPHFKGANKKVYFFPFSLPTIIELSLLAPFKMAEKLFRALIVKVVLPSQEA